MILSLFLPMMDSSGDQVGNIFSDCLTDLLPVTLPIRRTPVGP